jgi:hypothetical protein
VRRSLLTSTALLTSVALCGTARAADPAPPGDDKRPNAALAACASGDVAKGIAILGELYAETRNPSFVFNQGRCYQKNNQLEQARGSFAEYLRIGTNEPPEDLQRAQAFVKELDDALARQRASQPAVVVAPPASGDGAARVLRVSSVVLAAVGVLAVGFGAVMSLKVKSTNDDLEQLYAATPYVTDSVRVQQLESDGSRYQTLQWVGYGVGAAAFAGAVATFILGGSRFPWSAESPDRVALDLTPAVSPNGGAALLRMRF